MASAAMLRSAARSLRLRQPLEQQRCFLARQFLSSSVPTERHTCSPSSNKPLKGSMEQKRHANETTGDIYKRLLMKIDKISDDLDEDSRLLKQLEVQLEENNKHRGVIDLTPYTINFHATRGDKGESVNLSDNTGAPSSIQPRHCHGRSRKEKNGLRPECLFYGFLGFQLEQSRSNWVNNVSMLWP